MVKLPDLKLDGAIGDTAFGSSNFAMEGPDNYCRLPHALRASCSEGNGRP